MDYCESGHIRPARSPERSGGNCRVSSGTYGPNYKGASATREKRSLVDRVRVQELYTVSRGGRCRSPQCGHDAERGHLRTQLASKSAHFQQDHFVPEDLRDAPAHVRSGVDDRKFVVGNVEEADVGGDQPQYYEDELEQRYKSHLQLFTMPGASDTNPGGAQPASSSLPATSPEAGTCGTDALGEVVRTRGRSRGSPSCPRHIAKCADPVGVVRGSSTNDPLDSRDDRDGGSVHQYDLHDPSRAHYILYQDEPQEQQGPVKSSRYSCSSRDHVPCGRDLSSASTASSEWSTTRSKFYEPAAGP